MPLPRCAARPIILWTALLLATAHSTPAATAATATADQAQAVERELHDWLQAMLGTAITLPDRPVQLVPEGSDYALLIPFSANTAITGHLAPQDDGRWLLSDVKLPSPATFTLDLPMPAPGNGRANGTEGTTTRTYQFSVARQEITGTFDPSYKTASSLHHRFEDFQLSSSGAGFRQTTQTAHVAGQSTVTPAADGRFDIASESTFDGYVMDNRPEGGSAAVHVTADHGHTEGQISGLASDQGPAFLRDAIGFVTEILPTLSKSGLPDLTAEQRAQLRDLVNALDGIASGLQAGYAFENLQVQAGSIGGVARRAHLDIGGQAPNSVLNVYLDLGVEGLSIPGLPVSPYADLVPTEIHVRPTLAGIGTKELLTLARQLLDAADRSASDGRQDTPSPAPLFAHGGIAAGLDAVSFNLGPTRFTGHGTVTMTKPDAYDGQGQIMATNFDALMDRAKQDPTMTQALALLTIAKGIGRASGDQLVWDIAYENRRVLVNGVDVLAMAGAAAGNGGSHARPSGRSSVPPPAPSPSAKPPPQ
ncbi:MAG: hypothetical protein JO157_17080 [Acetobacteraceae bacterium]|nr:hypothetical protein [Acetobacteraceae bacterium]